MTTSVVPALAIDSRLEILQRVAGSQAFHRSPRLRELLVYICERAIQNRPQDLREQQIGCAVFGRKQDYNPGEDNIVRVEIRQLRKRLEDYFLTEGKDDPFIIWIPKGAYLPLFEPRTAPVANLADAISADEVVSADVPAVAGPEPWWSSLQHWALKYGQAAVILLLAASLVLMLVERKTQKAAAADPQKIDRGPLWPSLFDPLHRTFVVCADSSLVVAQALLGHPVGLDKYMTGEYATERGANPVLQSLTRWQFTDIADTRLVQRILKLDPGQAGMTSLHSARTAQIQDFKDGHSILLGSSRSNPWTHLFDANLNFQFEYDDRKNLPYIRNKAPLAGESGTYFPEMHGDSGFSYSLIAFVPNLRRTGNVLMIGGTAAEGTETAGEFITAPSASAGLLNSLTARNHGRLPYFEVLLKSEMLAGVAKNAEVVAVRLLTGYVSRN